MSGFATCLRKLFGRPHEQTVASLAQDDAEGDQISEVMRKHLDNALQRHDRATDGLKVASRGIREAVDAALAEIEQGKRGRRRDQ